MAYGDDSGFNAWLAARGHTLPVSAPTPAILRTRGSTYLDATYDGLWSGQRTDGVMQEDGWPRTGATVACITVIAAGVIPLAVVNASYRAAWLEASSPGILSASSSAGGRIKRQKVDVIEREFFDDGSAEAGSGGPSFIDAEIDGMMRQFICDMGAGFLFQSIGC